MESAVPLRPLSPISATRHRIAIAATIGVDLTAIGVGFFLPALLRFAPSDLLAATVTPSVIRRYVVPGRVELVGKHVDYAGGRSLTCAIDLALHIDAETMSEPVLRSSFSIQRIRLRD